MTKDLEAELLLSAARTAAEAVADTFGPDCEIAIHDLRQPTRSLVHLANGHVTGRQLGAPIRDLILRVIPSLEEGSDVVGSYATELDDGRTLKSTTCIMRDSDGDPIVAFCINLDVTRLRTSLAALQHLVEIDGGRSVDGDDAPNDLPHASEVMNFLIANVVRHYGKPEQMTKQDRLRAVDFLDDKGAFLIKGAVPLVAEALNVSEPSVYRYLEQVRATPRADEADQDRL